MIWKRVTWQSPVWMLTVAALALGAWGCSGRSAEEPAAPAAPAAPTAEPETVEVEVVEEEPEEVLRELGPEEAALNPLDEARRDFIRNHEAVLRALGEAPRLTFEGEQETPRFTTTTYLAETPRDTMRVRLNWVESDGALVPQRMDIQHREDGGFDRAWVARD